MQVINDEPVPPSQLNPKTPRDLETICLKCLRKEPAKRYATGKDLAADLCHFQAGEPIDALPVGRAERTIKWVRRRPMVAALLATLMLLSTVAGGIVWSQYWDVMHQKDLVFQEKVRAEKEAAEAKLQKAAAEMKTKETLEAQRKTEQQIELTQRHLLTARLFQVNSIYERDRATAKALLEDTVACPIELRDFAWGYYYAQSLKGGARATFHGHGTEVTSVSFMSDGKVLASGSKDGTIQLWDVNTSKETTLKGHTGAVTCVAFARDGNVLASGSADRTIRLWDVRTGQERATLRGHTGSVTCLAFAPDGNMIASGSEDRSVGLWNVAAAAQPAALEAHTKPVKSVAFVADGKRLVSTSMDDTTRIWDVSAEKEVASYKGPCAEYSHGVALAPDGKMCAAGYFLQIAM